MKEIIMKRFTSFSVLLAASLTVGFVAPAGAQLVYTAPSSTGLFAGVNAGNSSLTGGENTGVGYESLYGLTSGFWNTGLGAHSLASVTGGVSNTGIGVSAMTSVQGGARNTAVGQSAMHYTVDSSNNAAFGYHALSTLHTGGDATNTAVGYYSLHSLYEGSGNSALGGYSGEPMTYGFNGTFLGYDSGPTTDGLTNAAAVGYKAHVATSNSLVLGGTGDDAVKVGIGTTSPTHPLDVNGSTIRVRQDRTPASSSEACLKGEIAWDGSYLYICVATNTWKRTALSSF
jgi:hypothetical protein